jgi:predicted PhzF superfamily epimerase YddE/YHI9
MKYDPACYLAFVLSKETRADLIRFFPPTFEKVICHHVTIAFKLDEQLFDAIIKKIGENPTVVATGYMVGQNLDCFTVEVRRPTGTQHFRSQLLRLAEQAKIGVIEIRY